MEGGCDEQIITPDYCIETDANNKCIQCSNGYELDNNGGCKLTEEEEEKEEEKEEIPDNCTH